MRPLGIIIIGFSLMIGLGLGLNKYINHSAQELMALADEVSNAVIQAQWEIADAKLTQMEKQWDTTKTYWSIFLDHGELEQIDLIIFRLKEFIRLQSQVMAAGEVSDLQRMLNHIADTETFSLVNLL